MGDIGMKQGIWVPDEVLQNPCLTPNEKFVFSLIINLDQSERGCFARNDYIAKRLNISVTTASTAISKLIRLGYIRQDMFDGRYRHLKCCLSKFERQSDTNAKAASAKTETDNIYEFKTNKYRHSAHRKGSDRTHFCAAERPPISEAELKKELAGRNGNLV